MGFYSDHIVPWCVELSCGMKALAPERAKVTAQLHGSVLEVGFGSGHNLPYLPSSVTRLLAVEPSERARKIAQKRIATARCPVEFVGLDAEVLQLPDGSADCALSTFSLCTIPDAPRALAEIRRVLKPGGQLLLVEHGRAPDANIARWQDRLNGLQQVIAGGCNLNRDIVGLLGAAGFDARGIAGSYFSEMPRTHGYLYSGSAQAS